MEFTVHYNQVKISPRKIRAVLPMIKGKKVDKAIALIQAAGRPTAAPIGKLLKSSVAAARQKQANLSEERLKVKYVFCNEGRRLYRRRIKGRGRASSFAKRYSHITLTVETIPMKESKKAVSKAVSKIKK